MNNSQHNDCLFCRIVRGEIPATIVYRNEHVVAFKDISPTAPQHVLLIPVQHISSLNALTAEHEAVAGELLLAASKVAEVLGIKESGYRFVINTGADAMQTVFHIHAHVIGGQTMGWPPFQ